ncbi:MAG: hypothetical protein JO205_06115, partial [Pseudolabrys sp.]|nr:hypothetical protein [Pseudolabrys sp.]
MSTTSLRAVPTVATTHLNREALGSEPSKHNKLSPPLLLAAFLIATPSIALACACGCSVFDTGFSGLPQEDDHGGRIFYELDRSDQTRNWIGSSKADPNLNIDKRVSTYWHNVGLEYMFNRQWGVMVKVPYVTRGFNTLDADGVTIDQFSSKSIGDVEI